MIKILFQNCTKKIHYIKKYTIQFKIYKHKISVLKIFNKNKPS